MGLLSREKTPREKIVEAEREIAEHLRSLIQDEEGYLQKLAQLEKDPDEANIQRAEEALKSIGIAVQEDLDEVEEHELSIQDLIEDPELEVSEEFRAAANHNLELLEEMTAAIDEEDSQLGEWLNAVREEDDIEVEAEDLIGIEEKLSADLERIKGIMNSGETEFTDREGWINLSEFT